jgi:hypothetical protein
MADNDFQPRATPQSDLDLNLMMTDSVWGKPEINQELKDKLSKYYSNGKVGDDGKIQVTKESLWGLLGFYTRDMRLANLSSIDNELQTCRYMIDYANDLLLVNLVEQFLIALSRAATILETSQSKRGFLRIQMNTLRQEHLTQQIEPPKKGFFGKNIDSSGRL